MGREFTRKWCSHLPPFLIIVQEGSETGEESRWEREKKKKCYFENNFNKLKETNQIFLRKTKKVYTEKEIIYKSLMPEDLP